MKPKKALKEGSIPSTRSIPTLYPSMGCDFQRKHFLKSGTLLGRLLHGFTQSHHEENQG
jgi:hypothetical protein